MKTYLINNANGLPPVRRIVWLVILFVVLAGGVYTSSAAADDKPLEVFVSLPPQKFFVDQIGGPYVNVEVLLAPGHSEATYEPTSQQMARVVHADLYFAIDVPFERRLMDKMATMLQELKIVNTQQGIQMRAIENHVEDGHGHAGLPDPHTWLAPQLVKQQAETIERALAEMDPAHAAIYDSNLTAFQRKLDSVDLVIREKLSTLRTRTIYVFHPSYGYFADAYGLEQVAIEVGGKEPSARQLALLVEHAIADSVKAIFVQPQFSRAQAETIAEAIKGKIVLLDPLSGDYLNNLVDIADKIAEALGGSAKPSQASDVGMK